MREVGKELRGGGVATLNRVVRKRLPLCRCLLRETLKEMRQQEGGTAF